MNLSMEFGFSSEMEGRTQYWFWPTDFKRLDIPNLTPEQALIFHLSKAYLQPALPESYVGELDSYFERAEAVLAAGSSKASRWRKRIRVIQRGPNLKVPSVTSEVIRVLHNALLTEKRAAIHYKKRGEKKAREYEISLHGIVVKDGVVYGIVTFWNYTELNQIAFHRVSQATLLDTATTHIKGFDIDRYLEDDKAFAYPVEEGILDLRIKVSTGTAEHLSERPLSERQTQKALSADWIVVSAQVGNTSELRWWLLGFGDGVEVLAPKSLREEMKATALRMGKLYSNKQSK